MYYAWSVVLSMAVSFGVSFVSALMPDLRTHPGAIAFSVFKIRAKAIPASPRFWLLAAAVFAVSAGIRHLAKR